MAIEMTALIGLHIDNSNCSTHNAELRIVAFAYILIPWEVSISTIPFINEGREAKGNFGANPVPADTRVFCLVGFYILVTTIKNIRWMLWQWPSSVLVTNHYFVHRWYHITWIHACHADGDIWVLVLIYYLSNSKPNELNHWLRPNARNSVQAACENW